MGLLYWDIPPKKMGKEEWLSITADGAPAGVYVPNMDDKYREMWKAKFTGKTKPIEEQCIEIRKTQWGVQVLIRVYIKEVHISQNGASIWEEKDFIELQQVIAEAKKYIEDFNKEKDAGLK